ncbi:MAG: hypothetical protein EPN40_09710 [Rhodanobacteraceae bacterium]|nr:MAG: hypothetical protein EPN40_09710 [Rhodanobacteraceae bacterium]
MSNEPQTVHLALGMFLFVLVTFVLVPLTLMLWCHFEPLQVLQSGDAGTFRTAASHGDLTNVATSTGVITVKDGFSALVGQPLLVRTTNKYGLQLCTTGVPHHCTAVSGTWVGPMHTVTRNEHWYIRNFSGIRESLLPMLMMGSVTAFLALIATVAVAADRIRDDEDDRIRR